tara:strand:+ start:147 stop:1025 length:879 start_codon:yes stop_codon:yes gene_type:complete
MLKSEEKLSDDQKTIKKVIYFSGIGLHSGDHGNVKIKPSTVDTGITFIRTDLSKDNLIKAHWSNVTSTKLCTTISNKNNVSVSTIEHLMSALSGMHIDNAIIEIDSSEMPIMDGSAKPFVKLIEKAGIENQIKKRKYLKVLKDVIVENDQGSACIRPNNQFSINLEIDFPCSVIDKQSCQLKMINGNYKQDISEARTFGFEEEVESLRNSGFALGGDLTNAVVVGKDRILNKEGLRYKDEFVRHKILDSIGDLYLAGYPILGFFEGIKSGHKLNNELLKKLLSDKNNWSLVN